MGGLTVASCLPNRSAWKLNDIASMFIGYLIGMLYLCLSINNGQWYIFNYSCAISFVMPLGLVALDKLKESKYKKWLIYVVCFIILYIQFTRTAQRIINHEWGNAFSYFQYLG